MRESRIAVVALSSSTASTTLAVDDGRIDERALHLSANAAFMSARGK